MAVMVARRIKKNFWKLIGLSMFILAVYKSCHLTPFYPSLSRLSHDKELDDNIRNSFGLEIPGKHHGVSIEKNFNKIKYRDLETKIFRINNLKNNITDLDFNNNKRMEQVSLEPEMKDWHDYDEIKAALSRTGLGELGMPAFVDKYLLEDAQAAINESYYNYGINGYLSDQISVNRSVPDHRAEICKSRKYLAKLPKVSIIIPFKDECFSVLIRTLHSITNRTPPELLEEIIVIDDNSTLDNLKDNLKKYIKEYFPKVTLVRLTETNGLIRARLAGAKLAKSKILVIFDAHIEVGYNWLPPLIEPIVLNNRTCTCPYIDKIFAKTFRYQPVKGFRGAFDWQFFHHRLPLLFTNDETAPHQNPVMLGGIFAIWADFFWELGGYDNELQLWGGEQYELSFKIWMCGGTLLDIPCSRVGHIGQISTPLRYKDLDILLVLRNYIRIAEVWMDDYKKYIYDNLPEEFKNLDFGDISARKAVREKLQCKSFEWFLQEIAFDSLQNYPVEDPAAHAGGAIKSDAFLNLCIAMRQMKSLVLIMLECAGSRALPKTKEQTWLITKNGELRKKGEMECIEAKISGTEAYISHCHGRKGNQEWIHNKNTKMIMHVDTNRCLVASNFEEFLLLNECDENNINMRWEFSWYNETINQ